MAPRDRVLVKENARRVRVSVCHPSSLPVLDPTAPGRRKAAATVGGLKRVTRKLTDSKVMRGWSRSRNSITPMKPIFRPPKRLCRSTARRTGPTAQQQPGRAGHTALFCVRRCVIGGSRGPRCNVVRRDRRADAVGKSAGTITSATYPGERRCHRRHRAALGKSVAPGTLRRRGKRPDLVTMFNGQVPHPGVRGLVITNASGTGLLQYGFRPKVAGWWIKACHVPSPGHNRKQLAAEPVGSRTPVHCRDC